MVAQTHGGNQTAIAGHRQRLDGKPSHLAHLPSESMEQRNGFPISNHPDKIAPVRIERFEPQGILFAACPVVREPDHCQRNHTTALTSDRLYLCTKISAADHIELVEIEGAKQHLRT